MVNNHKTNGGVNDINLSDSIIKATKEAINETFKSVNKESDIAEIKTDIKYLTSFVEKSDKRNDTRFEKIETGLNKVLEISQDQETRIALIEKTNKEHNERIKSRIMVAAAFIAAIATIFWDVLKGMFKP